MVWHSLLIWRSLMIDDNESNQRDKENEREKTNKIVNGSATVTVHVCTVTVACINAQFYTH